MLLATLPPSAFTINTVTGMTFSMSQVYAFCVNVRTAGMRVGMCREVTDVSYQRLSRTIVHAA